MQAHGRESRNIYPVTGARPFLQARLLLLAIVCASGFVRWHVADYAQWGIDEAANLWQGTRILAGESVPVGLVSSRGVPNLAGAPVLAAPFSLLPDLLSISRTLSLLHLAGLVVLGLSLGRRSGRSGTIVAALAFHPALFLSSSSFWNQYLTLLFTALLIPLLFVIVEGRTGPAARAGALVAIAALAIAQPSVHLASFADLGVHLVLIGMVFLFRPAPVDRRILLPGLLLVLAGAAYLYVPWLERVLPEIGTAEKAAAAGGAVLAAVAAAVLRHRRVRAALEGFGSRALSSHALSWLWLASLCLCIGVVSFLPFSGAQSGGRLIEARDPAGILLLAAQGGMAAALFPEAWRIFRECRRGMPLGTLLDLHVPGPRARVLLLAAYPVLLLAARLPLEPTLLQPGGRSDLLLPLVPAFLAPLFLLAGSARSTAGPRLLRLSTVGAAAAFLWLSAIGFSSVFRHAHPSFVPPSEMRAAVDDVAVRHRARGGGSRIDLGYDLDRGLEWINEVACRPWTSWYSIGRPYDWLLLRRHGLRNTREGECLRLGGTGFQLGFVSPGAPPAGMETVRRLAHLEIRVPRN